MAPAIAAGCPIVLKPASQTPTVALLLAGSSHAGWPTPPCKLFHAARAAADRLVTDDRCKAAHVHGLGVSRLGHESARRQKKVALELGGNAAVVIDDTISEADLCAIIPKLVYGAYSYSGQKCISIQRIYVVAQKGDRLYRAVVNNWPQQRRRFGPAIHAMSPCSSGR